MTKLTDMQLVLLTTACQREDGSLLPPPESLGDHTARIPKAVTALIKLGMTEEKPGFDTARSWRQDGDAVFGVVITDAGRVVIMPPEQPPEPTTVTEAVQPSKKQQVIDLMKREGGATLADIVSATGWLPYTSRAALTGLRKKGHAIVAGKMEGTTRYTLADAA